jgi:peroxiredoxin
MKRILVVFAAATLTFSAPTAVFAEEDANPATETPAAEDLSSFKTADELWAHIEQLQRGPSRKPTSREDAIDLMKAFIGDMESALDSFLERFPEDPRRWSARLILVDLQNARSMTGGQKPDPAKLRSELTQIAQAKDAPGQTRSMARLNLLGLELQAAAESGTDEDLARVDQSITLFIGDYPDHQAIGPLKLQYALLLQSKNPDKTTALLKELEKNPDPNIAQQATALLAQGELKSKPLDLEFTAVDGSKVSLADLRGKVVLLDFWATWCGPCVQEVPNVVATYRKLHEKGFEIIGISLDQDKDALLHFTEEHGMTWPQYFDGEGWKNKISTQFGIRSIPAMWLLDRKGMVVSTNARANLEAQVNALLEN